MRSMPGNPRPQTKKGSSVHSAVKNEPPDIQSSVADNKSEEKRVLTTDDPEQSNKACNSPHIATDEPTGEHPHAHDIRPAITHEEETLIIRRIDDKTPGASDMKDKEGTTPRVTTVTKKYKKDRQKTGCKPIISITENTVSPEIYREITDLKRGRISYPGPMYENTKCMAVSEDPTYENIYFATVSNGSLYEEIKHKAVNNEPSYKHAICTALNRSIDTVINKAKREKTMKVHYASKKYGINKEEGKELMRKVMTMRTGRQDGASQIYGETIFEGACIDSGAEQSVIGVNQARAYETATGRKKTKAAEPLVFKFGDGEIPSQGMLDLRIPIPNGSHVSIMTHVVHADIPMLIGIEILHKEKMILNFDSKTVTNSRYDWQLPMTLKYGHVFLVWNKKYVCYTHAELNRLHLHFFHPAADRLFALVKKVKPQEAGGDLRNTINDITRACETCQIYSKKPFRFRASIPPEKVVFNH